MIYQIFTVYDAKVEAFLQPFFARSKGEAIRNFTAACDEQDHQFNKYAEDFTLFHLGEFDDNAATFETYATAEPVIKAIEARQQQELPMFDQKETS